MKFLKKWLTYNLFSCYARLSLLLCASVSLCESTLLLAIPCQPSSSPHPIPLVSVSPQDARKIGEKIWVNEGAGSKEFLTHWNKGEEFASMGIGHFIWYTADRKERFQEIFPLLLAFLQKEGTTLPSWLRPTTPCPWASRDAFYADIDSSRMRELRTFLYDTRDKQALFMAKRLEETLPQIVDKCPVEERKRVTRTFYSLAGKPNGLYALIDYLNFKGAGISPTEAYNGQGWGLRQVLLAIPASSQDPVGAFAQAAKELLAQRVRNSPPERNEKKWLEGWFNRLDTYPKEF